MITLLGVGHVFDIGRSIRSEILARRRLLGAQHPHGASQHRRIRKHCATYPNWPRGQEQGLGN